MTTFFIIPNADFQSKDWKVNEFLNVGPVQIYSGTYAGSWAVNTAIFGCDKVFEAFRTTLEAYPTAELTTEELTPTEESTQSS